jgi:hypothetical protein
MGKGTSHDRTGVIDERSLIDTCPILYDDMYLPHLPLRTALDIMLAPFLYYD